jgi:hypothetical protein
LTRLGFPDTEYNGGFAIMTGILSTLFNLSLRDVERAVMLYSFAQPLRNSSSASAWPIVIKLHKPELHRRLCATIHVLTKKLLRSRHYSEQLLLMQIGY